MGFLNQYLMNYNYKIKNVPHPLPSLINLAQLFNHLIMLESQKTTFPCPLIKAQFVYKFDREIPLNNSISKLD